ncbi:MAG: rhodanese-like domain-containing protein [Bacillaceae bacterium]|nr:rhodanese-like domain-containing protein [Bacillaceae bacterium]
MIILDVRETGEYRVGHIEGSLNIPLGQVLQRTGELDPNKDIVVVCRSGNRSALACEWLASRGFRVFNLDGGLTQWKHIQS